MKKGLFLAITAFSMFIYGCGTAKSAMDIKSEGNDQIPADFRPPNGTLLIEQSEFDKSDRAAIMAAAAKGADLYVLAYMTKNRDNMVEYAEKNYHHKHQFASQSEIYDNNSKYSDRSLYRYALVTSLVKPTQRDKYNERNNQWTSTNHQPIFRFYLYDRLNDKTYTALGRGSSLIMWAYKAAIKKLNEEK